MQKVFMFLSDFFMSKQETGNVNEVALIIVIISLLIALSISIILARKNNLYSRTVQKEETIIIHSNNEVA